MSREDDMEMQLDLLRSKEHAIAYQALNALLEMSDSSDTVYAYMDSFIEMLESESSYERNRALALVATNAKWDEDCKVDECLSLYLVHLEDEKPITVRQCIKGAAAIAQAKPNLKPLIVEALRNADASRYSDSMRPPIQADIRDALIELEA